MCHVNLFDMKKVITISRQFGSGGRLIGRELANRLGYRYFDKELIEEVAKETGLDKEFIEKNCENAGTRHRLLFNFGSGSSGYSLRDELYKVMCAIITRIGEEGNCVIVGRGADYILKDRNDVLNVFIRSDEEHRLERAKAMYGVEETYDSLENRDATRKLFYSNYTGRKWGDPENYDMVLDSGRLGEDLCIDIIEKAARTL